MYVHKRIAKAVVLGMELLVRGYVSLILLDAAKLFSKAVVLTPVSSMKAFNSHCSILSPAFGVVRFLSPDM